MPDRFAGTNKIENKDPSIDTAVMQARLPERGAYSPKGDDYLDPTRVVLRSSGNEFKNPNYGRGLSGKVQNSYSSLFKSAAGVYKKVIPGVSRYGPAGRYR